MRCSAALTGQLHQTSPQPKAPSPSATLTRRQGRSRIVPNEVATATSSGTRKMLASIPSILIGRTSASPTGLISSRRMKPAGERDARPLAEPRDADVFDVEIVLDAVFRAFAAHPGFLYAAERRDLGGDQPGIHADQPVAER